MEKSFHPLKGVAKTWREEADEQDKNQTLSRQLRSLVPVLTYCPDAEPPLNVSGDLPSAEYAQGRRVFVCLLAFHSGGAINTGRRLERLLRVPPITATLSILGSLQANPVK